MNNPEQNNKKIEPEVVAQKPVEKMDPAAQKPKVVTSPEAENISAEAGINLIPTLTKDEIVVEKKKKKLNVGSIVSLLILLVVFILIGGFSIISRMQLNIERDNLKTYESNVTKMSQKIISSNEITERVKLYNRVLGESYSPKAVVDYVNAIASKSGTSVVNKFSLGNDLSFSLDGNATDMENVAKFWYLLSNDPKMETVTLQSVGSGTNVVRFSFKGKLLINEFLTSTN